MLLAFAVLGTLIGRRHHPYALCGAINERIGRFWPVGPGQLHASLRRLERQRLVGPSDEGERGRCTYGTTPAGARAFDAWLSAVDGDGPGDGRGYDDGLAQIAVCARLGERALLRRTIEVHRERCRLLDRALARSAADVAGRAARDLLHAELEWLDAAERELLSAPATARSDAKST